MTDIPPPFVGGTDSPRRYSAEEKAFQSPYAPDGKSAAEAGRSGPESDEESASERSSEEEIGEIYEEDVLPDMANEGEDIAVEGPMYDLEWPEGPEPETRAEPSEPTAPGPDDAAGFDLAGAAEPSTSDADVPDFLLGADSDEDDVATETGNVPIIEDREKLADLALTMQSGPHRESIRELVAELTVYPPEIAVPRAFAAGYRAARKEKEK